MSSTRILRFGLVLAVAVGLAIGPVGAAVAAPERGDGARAGWGAELGEWVEAFWGWLVGIGDGREIGSDTRDNEVGDVDSVAAAETNDGGSGLDPNG